MHTEIPTQTGETTLSSKGQVVIPRYIRRAAGLDAGARLSISLSSTGKIELRPLRTRLVAELFGCLRRPESKPMSLKDMDITIMKQVLRDDERIKAYGVKHRSSRRRKSKKS